MERGTKNRVFAIVVLVLREHIEHVEVDGAKARLHDRDVGALPHDELARCGDLLGGRLVHLVDKGDIARRQLPDRVLRLRDGMLVENEMNAAPVSAAELVW